MPEQSIAIAPAKKATSASAAPRESSRLTGSPLRVAQILALLTVLLISSRELAGPGISYGHIAAFVLLPMWIPSFRRYVGGSLILILGVFGTAASIWLTQLASVDHASTSTNLFANTMLLTGTVITVGVLLWARQLLPMWMIGFVFGIGMLYNAVLRSDGGGNNIGENPWKYAFAVPLAIILTSLVMWTGRRWLEVAVLVGLAVASVAFDSRSYFAEFFLAAVLVTWQLLRKRSSIGISATRVLLIFAAITVVVYNVGTTLLVNGFLGAESQIRSVEQVDRAGSIIVGGRPEMAATAALFLFRPIGYGAGSLANYADLSTAKSGMTVINYDPNNGWVENFMFGRKFELHSMTGDLWAYFGPVSVLTVIVSLVLLLRMVGRGIADGRLDGLVAFVIVQSLWNFFFNPLYTSAPVLAIALGLGLSWKRFHPGSLEPARASDSAVVNDLPSPVPNPVRRASTV